MLEKMTKFRLLVALVLILQLVAIPSFSFAAEADNEAPTWVKPVTYLALGDSLAAGVTPGNKLGNGYTDFIAQALDASEVLNMYNKGFSFPGYTSSDILKDLKDNVTRPVFGKEGEKAELHQSIAASDIITISVGANDVLPYFKVDPATGTTSVDLAQITASIQQVGVNYSQMLKAIYTINPDVRVYVMGYYNPFPQVDAKYQVQISQLLNALNGSIQAGLQGTTATFIPTFEKIAEDYAANLPNPQNIHLSEAGYKAVADLFNKKLVEAYPWVSKDALHVEVTNNTKAKLTWIPAADQTGVTRYIIYNGKEKVAQVLGNVLTYEVGNLKENKAYTFTVAATDAAGNVSTLNPTTTITTGITTAALSDIKDHWAKDYITKAIGSGIVKGYPDGTFKPENNITRAQAASILVKALGLKTDKAAPFDDIDIYALETKAEIAAAYHYGIIKGANGHFRPNDYLTRAQLALMLKRTVEVTKGSPYVATKPAPFTDISFYDEETKTAISMLAEFYIVSGSNGKFMPNNYTKRGQAAKILVNSLALLKK